MSSRVSASNLSQALRELVVEWQQTKSYWRDVKSMEFERNYLEKLPGMVTQSRNVMEELDNLLRKVRNDCE
ncbi:MAG: hypothetical protein ACAI34_18580 [Verrucomicrobium sp.]|nr:hypothetical protein [Verrucomicrobium sp.]